MNANLYVIEDYENETAFRLQKNKPKTNPISRADKRTKETGKKISATFLRLLLAGEIDFLDGCDIIRAYPDNRVVMRPSEKSEAKAAGQKCSEAWFSPR
jgi:hypothetical protein